MGLIISQAMQHFLFKFRYIVSCNFRNYILMQICSFYEVITLVMIKLDALHRQLNHKDYE